MEPVTIGDPPGLDAENRGRNHFVTKQQHCPMYRPDKFIITVAPAHPLGNRQASQRVSDDAGNQISGQSARLKADLNQPRALVGFLPLQIGHRHSAGAGETLRRFSRGAIRAKGSADRRAAPFKMTIWLADRHVFNQHR